MPQTALELLRSEQNPTAVLPMKYELKPEGFLLINQVSIYHSSPVHGGPSAMHMVTNLLD